MKTPREILLQHHRAAEPRLNEIRRAAIANRPMKLTILAPTLASVTVRKLWHELILPCRRTWAGLAAVWLVLFAFQVTSRDTTEVASHKTQLPSAEMIRVLREQQLLFAELVQRTEPPAAERPKAVSPRPHSQRHKEILVV
jgi:hypothetical protein